MTFDTWLLFFVMETALSLSPGPAVFYVVSQGTRGGLRRTAAAAAGILSANAIYFVLSATGLGAIIAASGRCFAVAKWAGAVYLLYLGVRTLRSSGALHEVVMPAAPEHPSGTERMQERMQALSPVYAGALTLQLANPKALLFFLALLPQFINVQTPVVPQMAILAATSMIPEFCILCGYGWLASRAMLASARFGVGPNINQWLARIEGIGLLGCAALVVNFRRR